MSRIIYLSANANADIHKIYRFFLKKNKTSKIFHRIFNIYIYIPATFQFFPSPNPPVIRHENITLQDPCIEYETMPFSELEESLVLRYIVRQVLREMAHNREYIKARGD